MTIFPFPGIFRACFLFAASGLLLLAGGCGGGGGSPAPVSTPNLAPSSVSGHSMMFTDPDQPQITTTYTFTASAYTSPTGDSGSYTYSTVAGTTNQASLQVVSVFSTTASYSLTFTSYTGGTYRDALGKSGNFTYN